MRIFLVILVIVAAAVLALSIAMRQMILIAKQPKVDLRAFDSRDWKAASSTDASFNSVRLRMADSFLSGQQPIGKSRAEIVALLGEPDKTPYFRNYDMVYYLGPERNPISIDSEWLVLKLTDGVVTDARLVRD